VQDGSEVTQQWLLFGLFGDLIAAQKSRVFMAQAYDLFNEVKLSLGEDNPIMEAPPLIKVQFKRSDRSLKGDELLRARPITSAPVLTLPIPSIRV